ncbi:hypothetical protein EI983_15595 [Roseovarius faecimaris]|uniref:DUF2244 domain-containing protein n=1 Tax=Roseovarius faecimaris TaxID=2494550 RepID=A0A6I6ITT5_9RHOB|nr:hypothetical protein [Roseovarius faecimaris]QGX99612.1 hypothetical protein EI983_15595 [Roseovarius faecimaris]
MKVTHDSHDTLILDHIPWALAIGLSCLIVLFVGIGLVPLGLSPDPLWWLFSALFIIVGGGLWLMALELFARRLQFVFDRSQDRITIRRVSVFRRREASHRLSRLIEARIEQSTGQNGQALTRPVLILRGKSADQTVPLHSYYTSGNGPEAMVAAINNWWLRDGSGQAGHPSRA